MEDRFCRGVKPQTLHELQQALEHRHKLAQQKEEALSSLWSQLGHAISNSNQRVQHSNVNLQLLLDIDQTLLYSRKIRGFYPNYPDDPDMQPFRQLARQFWKWRNEAMACYDEGNDWPNWAPSARVNGREVSMWFPEVRLEEPESKDHPIPEFVQPVYSASSGELTHYIVMYGAITWLSETQLDGNQDLDIYCCITVVPAEITILTSLRYELAEALDALRPTRISTCNSHDEMPSGETHVNVYLASCGKKDYVHRVCSLLEAILGCQHASKQGRVFADRIAFDDHDGTFGSCIGIKRLAPFNLEETQEGLLCPRLVMDDVIRFWDVDEQQHKVRLVHVEPFKGRWQYGARAESQHEPKDCHDNGISSDQECTADGASCTQSTSSHRMYSPVIQGVLNPPPDGLDRLLAETLQLIAQAFDMANTTEQLAPCGMCNAESKTADAPDAIEVPSCRSDGAAEPDADPSSHLTDVKNKNVSGTAVAVPQAAPQAVQATGWVGQSAHIEAAAAAESGTATKHTDPQYVALQYAVAGMCTTATDRQTRSAGQATVPEEVIIAATPTAPGLKSAPDFKPAAPAEGAAVLSETSNIGSRCKKRRLTSVNSDPEVDERYMRVQAESHKAESTLRYFPSFHRWSA